MILTIRISGRSYRLVSAQTAEMRFSSCKDSADQARRWMIPGAFSYGRGRWETSVCRSRRVHRSANPAFPGHQISSCGAGSSQGALTMSNQASGANVTRLFDPQASSHYALSESAKLELDMLFGAMTAVSCLSDTPPGQSAPDIDPQLMAPLFYTFAAHGARIMADVAWQSVGNRASA